MVVAGGGPAGSQVAHELARSGHSVAVLEKRKKLGESVCCTGIVSLECVRRFDIPSSLVRREFSNARFFSPSGDVIELSYPKPLACLLDRASLDEFMALRACKSGADYRLAHEVKSLEVTDDRVILNVESNGKEFKIEARTLVLATGAGSKLKESAGLGKLPALVMGAQCEVEAADLNTVEIHTGNEVAPGFFAWLAPSSPGKALAGLMSKRNTREYSNRFLSLLQIQGKITSDNSKVSFRPITLNAQGKTFGDRILVVGGAAGQVKPTTGGGIFFGLICADIAAGVLSSCLDSNNLTACGLARYEREWKVVLEREIRFGDYARRFYERLTDERIEQLFKLAKSSDIETTLARIPDVSFDWHSKTIKGILGYGLISKKLNKAGIPFV